MISALVTDTENTMTALGKSLPMDHHYCAAHVWELTTVLFNILAVYVPYIAHVPYTL